MFNLNYDMISRDEESDTSGIRCNLLYTKAFPILEEMTLDHIEEYNIDLEPFFRSMERPRGGSDFASFAAEDIPVLSINAGFHPDYHQPTDHTSKANWGKMVEVIKVGFLNLWELANMDTFLQ
jgi:hypothetical protein